MTYEQWRFEGGEWIISNKGERIAQIYNWHAGYQERGERIARLPQLELQNADLLDALEGLLVHLWDGRKRNVKEDYSLMVAEVAAQEAICKAKETGQ